MGAHTQIDIELNAEGDVSKIPATTEDIHELKAATDQASEASKENAKQHDRVKGTLTEVGHAARGGTMVWKGLGDILAGEVSHGIHLVTRGLRMLWTTMTANPIGVVLAALGLLAGALVTMKSKWGEAKEAAKSFEDELKKTEEAAKTTAAEVGKVDSVSLEQATAQAKALTDQLARAGQEAKELRRLQDELESSALALKTAKLDAEEQTALKGVINKDQREQIHNKFEQRRITTRMEHEKDQASNKKYEAELDLVGRDSIERLQARAHSIVSEGVTAARQKRDEYTKILSQAGMMNAAGSTATDTQKKQLAKEITEGEKPLARESYAAETEGLSASYVESDADFEKRQAKADAELAQKKKLFEAMMGWDEAKSNADKADATARQDYEKFEKEQSENKIARQTLSVEIRQQQTKIEQASVQGQAKGQELQNKMAEQAHERWKRENKERLEATIEENHKYIKEHQDQEHDAQREQAMRNIAKAKSYIAGLDLPEADADGKKKIIAHQAALMTDAESQIAKEREKHRKEREAADKKEANEGMRDLEVTIMQPTAHAPRGGHGQQSKRRFGRHGEQEQDATPVTQGLPPEVHQGMEAFVKTLRTGVSNGNQQMIDALRKYHQAIEARDAAQLAPLVAELQRLAKELKTLRSQFTTDPRR